MDYVVMAYTVIACIVMAYLVMAYIFLAHIVMACMVYGSCRGTQQECQRRGPSTAASPTRSACRTRRRPPSAPPAAGNAMSGSSSRSAAPSADQIFFPGACRRRTAERGNGYECSIVYITVGSAQLPRPSPSACSGCFFS